MTDKRYAIVRVDNGWCPLLESDELCDTAKDCFSCKIKTRYGDTKEQLIMKVAQVFFKRKLKSYKKLFDIVPNKADAKQVYKRCLDVAKEIVEFLGVE